MSENQSNKELILVVDDTPSVGSFLRYALQEKDMLVEIVESGYAALKKAAELKPDLILLDIMMPDIDGYTVCNQLKADQNTKNIPVIFLSALDSQFDKIKAFKSGGVDFITKPIQSEEFIARVKTHLTISKLSKNLIEDNKNLENKIKSGTQNFESANENLNSLNHLLQSTLTKYKQTKEDAEATEKLKSDLLTSISHEIRTPANAIARLSDLIIDSDCSNNQIKEYASDIKKQSDQLNDIVDNIIQFSILELGKAEINLSQQNFNLLVADTVGKFMPAARNKNITIEFKSDVADGTFIVTDKTKFETALSNLLDNAVKFTDRGGVEVAISSNTNEAIFSIRDTGCGIDPNIHEDIFKPFCKYDNPLGKNYSGAGLGLSITKRLVEIAQGKIWFDSTPGSGSVFYVSVPIVISEHKDIYPDSMIFSGKTLLLGEDEDVAFLLISELLKPTGISVLRARNDRELYEFVRNKKEINLIITNLSEPVIKGSETIKLIKKINPQIHILAQISYFSARERKMFSESDCEDFIEKPVKEENLINTLKKILL